MSEIYLREGPQGWGDDFVFVCLFYLFCFVLFSSELLVT